MTFPKTSLGIFLQRFRVVKCHTRLPESLGWQKNQKQLRGKKVYILTKDLCDGGEAGNLHPGLWKIPPRLLENPTQGSGKLQDLHKPCDYTFLDKQVSEEIFKK